MLVDGCKAVRLCAPACCRMNSARALGSSGMAFMDLIVLGLVPLAAAKEFEMITHFIITSADDLYISPSLSSASEAAYLQEWATLGLSKKQSGFGSKKTRFPRLWCNGVQCDSGMSGQCCRRSLMLLTHSSAMQLVYRL